MAGLGRKVFTRERLTSADVNGYLMDQTVMVFASASARNTAITSGVVTDGMVSYLQDTNQLELRKGGAWKAVTAVEAWVLSITPFSAATETRATVNNLTVDLLPGRLYELSGQGQWSADADGTACQVNIRGARAATPTATSVLVAVNKSTVVSAARPITFALLGRFTVATAGSYTLAPFVRRYGAAGIPTVGPDDSGVWSYSCRDLGGTASSTWPQIS